MDNQAAGNQQKTPLRIDDNLLSELGLGSLPQDEKSGLLKHIYETLEMRVGMRLADQMSNEQLDEFETFYNAKDDAGAFKWLETNFPNYKDIVADEFSKLKAEVAQSVPQILAASQQSAAAAPTQQPGAEFSAPTTEQPLPAAVPAQPVQTAQAEATMPPANPQPPAPDYSQQAVPPLSPNPTPNPYPQPSDGQQPPAPQM